MFFSFLSDPFNNVPTNASSNTDSESENEKNCQKSHKSSSSSEFNSDSENNENNQSVQSVQSVILRDISSTNSELPIIGRSNQIENRKMRKFKRNRGLPYIAISGKRVKAKTMKPLYPCRCNCEDLISPECQETIHQQYWEMGNFNLRLAFLAGLIIIVDKKTTRIKKKFDCTTKPSAVLLLSFRNGRKKTASMQKMLHGNIW